MQERDIRITVRLNHLAVLVQHGGQFGVVLRQRADDLPRQERGTIELCFVVALLAKQRTAVQRMNASGGTDEIVPQGNDAPYAFFAVI